MRNVACEKIIFFEKLINQFKGSLLFVKFFVTIQFSQNFNNKKNDVFYGKLKSKFSKNIYLMIDTQSYFFSLSLSRSTT